MLQWLKSLFGSKEVSPMKGFIEDLNSSYKFRQLVDLVKNDVHARTIFFEKLDHFVGDIINERDRWDKAIKPCIVKKHAKYADTKKKSNKTFSFDDDSKNLMVKAIKVANKKLEERNNENK